MNPLAQQTPLAPLHPVVRLGRSIENTIAFLALVLIALLPTIEVIARFFKTGIHGSTEYVEHLVIIIAFVGAMITSRENRHLSFSAGIERIKPPLQNYLKSITALISNFVISLLAFASYEFIQTAFSATDKIVDIPARLLVAVIPIGLAFALLRNITNAPLGFIHKAFATCGVISAACTPLLPLAILPLLVWPSIIILCSIMFLGAPVFVVLGGFSLLFFATTGGSIAVIPNEAYTLLTGPSIPAIPLFTLGGFILSASKAGERLVRLFKATFGWMPGGLAIATILICTFFTSLTGASGVTILALGGILSFVLLQSGYAKKFTHGLITVSGIGTLFPPSLPLIMYGVIAHINIQHLFIGASIPGLFLVAILSLFVVFNAKKASIPTIQFNRKELFSSIIESIWEIILPFLILFLFFSGICTLVETGSITVVYLLIVEIFIKRDIAFKALPKACLEAMPVLGGILIVLAIAMGLSYAIVDAGIPEQLSAWLLERIHSKLLFLLILNIVLLIAASVMDVFGAIIVIVPLIIPLGIAYGIDPIHLGIIFLANLELGYLTPPLGLNLFLSSFRFDQPFLSICKSIIPFFLVLFGGVLIISYVPGLSLWIFDVLKIAR